MDRFATSLLGEAKTLLLATDGSPFSDGAVQEAIFFGQACSAKIVALHVAKVEAESLKSANATVMRRQRAIAPHLEQIRAMAQDCGVECDTVVVGSSFRNTPCRAGSHARADVILMGRHGRAGRLYS
jgi:nucleotide-binding universal stress UspA family protein